MKKQNVGSFSSPPTSQVAARPSYFSIGQGDTVQAEAEREFNSLFVNISEPPVPPRSPGQSQPAPGTSNGKYVPALASTPYVSSSDFVGKGIEIASAGGGSLPGVYINPHYGKSNCRKKTILAVFLAVLVLVAIVLGVVLSQNQDNGNENNFEIGVEVRRGNDYISVVFLNDPEGLSAQRKNAFAEIVAESAQRWSNVIVAGTNPTTFAQQTLQDACPFISTPFNVGNFVNQQIVGGILNHLVVMVEVSGADGFNDIFTSPCFGNDASNFAVISAMRFNPDVLNDAFDAGQEKVFVLHEFGHALGIDLFGGLGFRNLIINPVYNQNFVANLANSPLWTGVTATAQFNQLSGQSGNVPVENGRPPFDDATIVAGGAIGIADVHWDFGTFPNEAFTFFILDGETDASISVVSVGALLDIGLTVDLTKAESYTFNPLASKSANGENSFRGQKAHHHNLDEYAALKKSVKFLPAQ